MSQVPDAVALSQATAEQVKAISEHLKAIPNTPSCLAICCMRSAATIALQRANLLSKVLPSLLGVATRGVVKIPSVGDGQSSVTASMGVTLKDVLLRVLKSGVDAAKPWRKRLADALKGMGAETQAESALRHLDRLDRCGSGSTFMCIGGDNQLQIVVYCGAEEQGPAVSGKLPAAMEHSTYSLADGATCKGDEISELGAVFLAEMGLLNPSLQQGFDSRVLMCRLFLLSAGACKKARVVAI